MKNKNIKVTLKKSTIGLNEKQKSIVRGLGLKKIGTSKTLENTPCIRGMIKKVIQLVDFVE